MQPLRNSAVFLRCGWHSFLVVAWYSLYWYFIPFNQELQCRIGRNQILTFRVIILFKSVTNFFLVFLASPLVKLFRSQVGWCMPAIPTEAAGSRWVQGQPRLHRKYASQGQPGLQSEMLFKKKEGRKERPLGWSQRPIPFQVWNISREGVCTKMPSWSTCVAVPLFLLGWFSNFFTLGLLREWNQLREIWTHTKNNTQLEIPFARAFSGSRTSLSFPSRSSKVKRTGNVCKGILCAFVLTSPEFSWEFQTLINKII